MVDGGLEPVKGKKGFPSGKIDIASAFKKRREIFRRAYEHGRIDGYRVFFFW
jgi:hypothetical protein